MVYPYKKIKTTLYVVVGCVCSFFLAAASPLLVEHLCEYASSENKAVWVLESADGFMVYRERDGRMQRLSFPKSLVIRWVKGDVYLQGRVFNEKTCSIVPCNGSFVLRGVSYSGSLRFGSDDKGCSLKRYSSFSPLYETVARDVIDFLRSEKKSPKKETALAQLETTPTIAHKTEEQKERALGVKVLLAEESLDHGSFSITIPSGKSWALDPNERERFVALRNTSVVVQRRSKQWVVNGQVVSRGSSCWIRPEGGLCGYNGVMYHGSLLFIVDKNVVLVINCLELEAYVSCVLYAESWPGWPLEVNKVMAIACRTYALSMIADARQRHKLYHIKNTNIHQMYEGAHSVQAIHEAVEQTRGLFLSYKNRPIRAMFDACCGSIVPSKVEGFDFVAAPYLARKQACTYCKTSKVFNWDISYSAGDLASRLAPLCPGLTSIIDITVAKRDPAGLVKTVLIKDKKRSYSVSGKKVYSLLREVKSFAYSISKQGSSFVFKGRGYGHHMGLCQWGAREMVRQGYSYNQILSFYYPGVSLMRL